MPGKHGPHLQRALMDWASSLRWSDAYPVTFAELAIDFELQVGMTLPLVGMAPPPQSRAFKPDGRDYHAADEISDTGTILCFDGGVRGNGTPYAVGGAGAVIYASKRKQREIALPLPQTRSNNVAEYIALLAGLQLLREARIVGPVEVRGDSSVVIRQLRGEAVPSTELSMYLDKVRRASASLSSVTFTFQWIPREENMAADALSNQAMNEAARILTKDKGERDLTQEYHAYNAGLLGKARSLERLCSELGRYLGTPLLRGYKTQVGALRGLGGQVALGLSMRPILAQSTLEVLRRYQEWLASNPILEDNLYWGSDRAWLATFRPTQHYPAGWNAKQSPLIVPSEEAGGLYRPRPGEPAEVVPLGVLRANGKAFLCLRHSKSRCTNCTSKRQAVSLCCSYHHGDTDGLPIKALYCLPHRMSKCGNCAQVNRSMHLCCKEHHALPSGPSAVT